MSFSLAHDDEGMPVEVPPMAAGWLVRRHGGGKGRPGAVYDRDGRPLVVPLDATAGDLRALGCKASAYRLDAVDAGGKPLGVTAYTEVSMDDTEAACEQGAGDQAVAALARAVEAMQRVQAERERVQAAMFEKLIERIAPAAPRPVDDLRNAVAQVIDLQKAMRKATEDGKASDDDAEDLDDDGASANDAFAGLVPLIQQLMPLLVARLSAPTASPAPTASTPEAGQAELSDEEIKNAIMRVLRGLTKTERRKAIAVVETATPDVVSEIARQLHELPPEIAIARLRQVLATLPGQPAAAENGASNGEPTP